MAFSVTRFHDISTGHRVVGHEGNCRFLHGHNYRVHFCCESVQLDGVGRVVDFGVIKEKLCMWLESHWDHKFLAWVDDPLLQHFVEYAEDGALNDGLDEESINCFVQSVVWVPFNPIAENMAWYLVEVIAPVLLSGTGARLVSVTIEETAKCSASYFI